MDAQSLTELIQTCAATGRACQARYVQLPPVDASPKVQLSTFAFFVRNVVRQRALQRIAGRVHLVGTGMAFPWSVFSGAQLASANIVEDLELGLTLADQDVPPIFVEGAIVASDAATARNTLDQRRRWEGGFLQSAARFGPRQLMKAIRHTNPRELWAALDLFVPPFALLLLIDAGLFVGGLVAASVTRAARLPVAVLGASIALAVIGLLLAWAAGGRRFVSAKGLLLAPAYVLWKVPLYLGFAQHGAPRQWVRTGRE
jgi:hypothetical protein